MFAKRSITMLLVSSLLTPTYAATGLDAREPTPVELSPEIQESVRQFVQLTLYRAADANDEKFERIEQAGEVLVRSLPEPLRSKAQLYAENLQAGAEATLPIANITPELAYIAGFGFILASFFKFHQHKINPTQIPISQPIALLLIGAGLIYFASSIPTSRTRPGP